MALSLGYLARLKCQSHNIIPSSRLDFPESNQYNVLVIHILSPCSPPTVSSPTIIAPPPHLATPRISFPPDVGDDVLDEVAPHVPDVSIGAAHLDGVVFEEGDEIEAGVLLDRIEGPRIEAVNGFGSATPLRCDRLSP